VVVYSYLTYVWLQPFAKLDWVVFLKYVCMYVCVCVYVYVCVCVYVYVCVCVYVCKFHVMIQILSYGC
jgi:hypothetical protein